MFQVFYYHLSSFMANQQQTKLASKLQLKLLKPLELLKQKARS